jgi:3-deoxy-D-manno-octulosonic-acid transferase
MVGWLFESLQLVLCQFQPDADRFQTLGIAGEKIQVTGSLKFDTEFDGDLPEQGLALRASVPDKSKIWIAASTHEGEDAKVLAVHKQLKQRFPSLKLILVPRHPERFESAYNQSRDMGFVTRRYSESPSLGSDEDVYVLDAMGQLMRFYAASDLVFIGGSLTEVGGHNPIEPGALGKAMIIGPHFFNFQMICQEFIDCGALQTVDNESQLADALSELIESPDDARAKGEKAYAVVERGKGATARVVDAIAPLF